MAYIYDELEDDVEEIHCGHCGFGQFILYSTRTYICRQCNGENLIATSKMAIGVTRCNHRIVFNGSHYTCLICGEDF